MRKRKSYWREQIDRRREKKLEKETEGEKNYDKKEKETMREEKD